MILFHNFPCLKKFSNFGKVLVSVGLIFMMPLVVNLAKPAGEWQIYDIIFHQPICDGDKLLHPGSVTVFFNGVSVQDHWEMEGLTIYCKRRPLEPHALKGPLQLQNHGCVVQFRNIWYRPLVSRWANTAHSSISAKRDDVMALRRATAAQLYAKIPQSKIGDTRNYSRIEFWYNSKTQS